jgi:hypothetical protein
MKQSRARAGRFLRVGWREDRIVAMNILAVFLVLGAAIMPLAAQGHSSDAAPRQLGFEVSDYTDPHGKAWIHLSGEFECEYAESVQDIVSTLRDFAGTPRVFSRIEEVRVRSTAGTTVVTEQRSAVRVLGFAFVSNLVFRNELASSGSKAATVSFELIEGDGSCLATRGAWELVDRSVDMSPRTYARFRLESYVEPRFPGQAAIMRGFGAGDMKRTMRELGQATKRS